MSDPSAPADPNGFGVPGEARILERGYRRYDGPRLGRANAVRSVAVHAAQRVLGLKRPAWTKVLPVLSIAIAYVPAIVFVGIVAIVPDTRSVEQSIPTYAQYYGFIIAAIALFTGFVAPEVLCPDRRSGMLGIYLASPLTRDSYLLGKALAVCATLATVTVGPPFIMMVAFRIQGHGPVGTGNLLLTGLRIIASGLAMAVFYTALSLAASSLTERKAFASMGIIVAFFGTMAAAGALGLNGSHAYRVISLLQLPLEVANRIHGASTYGSGLGTGACYGSFVAWIVLFTIVTRVRYARLQVTR